MISQNKLIDLHEFTMFLTTIQNYNIFLNIFGNSINVTLTKELGLEKHKVNRIQWKYSIFMCFVYRKFRSYEF